MTYTKNDIRLVDFFALMLIAFGVLFLLLGVPQLLSQDEHGRAGATGKASLKTNGGSVQSVLAAKNGKGSPYPIPGLYHATLGFVFVCLGIALNIGVRRVIKNKGKDIEEYAGVPDSPPNNNG